MLKKSLAVALMSASLMTMTTGCIGRMAMSGKVLEWNLRVAEEKWPRELVFFLLYVIPVYPFTGALDLLIFNSIEFWTGTNPINGEPRLAKAGDRHEEIAEDGSKTVSVVREDGSLDMTLTDRDGKTQFVNLTREPEGIVVRDSEGIQVGHVDTAGRLVMAGADTER
jgi:hypothetical protein